MAVKAPSPPTPPTPPTVPGVTLSEGGSVTQSNAPPANGTTSKSTDNEKQMEEQAREAVASGSGGLSRTTQKNPAAEAKAAKAAAKEAQQSGQNQAQATIDTGRSQAAQAANLGSAGAVPQDSSGKAVPGQEAATLQADPAPKFDYHGLTYWLPMLVVAFVAAALLVKKFLHRQGRKGELTKADIEADALGAVESRELRGLTPDEVLARLEAQEVPAKVEAARTQVAKAKIKQSYSQKPKPKAKAAPKKPPKTKVGPRKTTQEEERQRFEVRI